MEDFGTAGGRQVHSIVNWNHQYDNSKMAMSFQRNAQRLQKQFPPRNSEQIWVFYMHEAPRTEATAGDEDLPISKFGFNWTVSYRESSEISTPYRSLYLPKGSPPPVKGLWSKINPHTAGIPDM